MVIIHIVPQKTFSPLLGYDIGVETNLNTYNL